MVKCQDRATKRLRLSVLNCQALLDGFSLAILTASSIMTIYDKVKMEEISYFIRN